METNCCGLLNSNFDYIIKISSVSFREMLLTNILPIAVSLNSKLYSITPILFINFV